MAAAASAHTSDNSGQGKGNVKEYLRGIFSAKEPKAQAQGGEPVHNVELGDADMKPKKAKHSQCCKYVLEGLFVALSILLLIKSVAEIIVTVSAAILTRLYDPEQSGRLVGLIILALQAAVVITVVINALVAVFRNKVKPLKVGITVLVVAIVVQAIVLGLTCRATSKEEIELAKSLQNSFQQARYHNPKQTAIWAATQNDLHCCGVFGPEDYRTPTEFFTPDVPISCCPSYDSDKSEILQERERQTCKSRKLFYNQGCSDLVIVGFRNAAYTVVALTVSMIITEVIIAFIVGALARKIKKHHSERHQNSTEHGLQKEKTES